MDDGAGRGGRGNHTDPERGADPRPARTERDWRQNRAHERGEDRNVARRAQPSAPEQQMMALLTIQGERYGETFHHEHKIVADDGWFIKYVDFAFPQERLVIEVYGGVHRDPFFSAGGTRQERDARLIAEVRAAGWRVEIIQDYELSAERWPATVRKVRRMLASARRGTRTTRTRRT